MPIYADIEDVSVEISGITGAVVLSIVMALAAAAAAVAAAVAAANSASRAVCTCASISFNRRAFIAV